MKHQAPSSKLQRNTKHQITATQLVIACGENPAKRFVLVLFLVLGFTANFEDEDENENEEDGVLRDFSQRS